MLSDGEIFDHVAVLGCWDNISHETKLSCSWSWDFPCVIHILGSIPYDCHICDSKAEDNKNSVDIIYGVFTYKIIMCHTYDKKWMVFLYSVILWNLPILESQPLGLPNAAHNTFI